MTSRREAIYTRMEAILLDSGCFDTTVRNEFIEDESSGRIAMLFDGDEEPLPNTGEGKGRPAPGWPRPTVLSPEVYILTNFNIKTVDVGPWLSWAIEKVKFLFLHDTQLLALLYERDPIVYDGAATGLATGRSLAGEVSLRFTLRFVDRYEDPGAEPAPTPDEETTEPP